MHRRQYLAGLAGGFTAVAGCLSMASGSGEALRAVSVAETRTAGIDVAAELLESTVTVDNTVTGRVT